MRFPGNQVPVYRAPIDAAVEGVPGPGADACRLRGEAIPRCPRRSRPGTGRRTAGRLGRVARFAAARTPAFKWVNTALGNIKAAITGTYRSISQKHVPRYLAEFEYRFNRRYDLAAMMPRLGRAALRTPPMPYRLLKMAEVSG